MSVSKFQCMVAVLGCLDQEVAHHFCMEMLLHGLECPGVKAICKGCKVFSLDYLLTRFQLIFYSQSVTIVICMFIAAVSITPSAIVQVLSENCNNSNYNKKCLKIS